MSCIQTVKIKNDADGYIVINETDFDSQRHVPFDEESAKSVKNRARRRPSARRWCQGACDEEVR
jgi:hypothetical protein